MDFLRILRGLSVEIFHRISTESPQKVHTKSGLGIDLAYLEREY
jgi:hypothetical protein